MRLISFNVNGIRAIHKKGFLEWLNKDKPDILCIQETKASEEQVPDEIKNFQNYSSYFSSSKLRKGYSGVGVFSQFKPLEVFYGIGQEKFDDEGRILILKYDKFYLVNLYCPNGGDEKKRVPYKLEFYEAILEHLNMLKKKSGVVICGDVNTAHKEIDLTHPKENIDNTGFLPEERAWIDKLLSDGYIDTFREFNKEGSNYTWWDYKTYARERNVGWRLDYFFISDNIKQNLKNAFILPEVMGSDHCPVGIEIIF